MLSVVPMDITSTVLFYHGKSIVLRLEPPAPPISLNYHWLLSVAGTSISIPVLLAASATTATTGHAPLGRLAAPMTCTSALLTSIRRTSAIVSAVAPSATSTQVVSNDKIKRHSKEPFV